jgi:hypothetical protein
VQQIGNIVNCIQDKFGPPPRTNGKKLCFHPVVYPT